MESGTPSQNNIGQPRRQVVAREPYKRIERKPNRGRQLFLLFCIFFLLIVFYLISSG